MLALLGNGIQLLIIYPCTETCTIFMQVFRVLTYCLFTRYVRTNRKRLKGENVEDEDCKMAVDTLFSVLYTMVRVFAPFTPFLTEQMYQILKPLVKVRYQF